MIVVDTNILIMAINRRDPHHQIAFDVVQGLRERPGAWYLTWGICFEFLRVVTHSRALPQPRTLDEGWLFFEGLRRSPGLHMLVPGERFSDVASQTFAEYPELRGNVLHDTQTAVLMREHGVGTIYTRDNDFRRFRFLTVVDPVAEPRAITS